MPTPAATLFISSRNYSSWSLRGWLLVRLSGLACATRQLESTDATARAELLLQTASTRIPYLDHDGVADLGTCWRSPNTCTSCFPPPA